MTPTSLRTLLTLAVTGCGVALLIAGLAYSSLPPLPVYAPFTLLLLALFELLLGQAVRARVAGRPGRRGPMHPLQVARAAALAKASSPTGALLGGAYLGLLVHVLPLESAAAQSDARLAGLSAVAALGLVVGALRLEQACRTPPREDDAPAA